MKLGKSDGSEGAADAPRPRALLLDLDGTLLDEHGAIRPRNRAALLEAERAGVRVMVVTGRSAVSAIPVLDDLGLSGPAVLFNGAAVWCPQRRRLLEERVLSNRTLRRALEFSSHSGLATVVMRSDRKLALRPRNEFEERALAYLHGLEFVSDVGELTTEFVVRVTWFSDRHADSGVLAREVEDWLAQPAYLTHFPLNMLIEHRASPLSVVDAHPPCKGKAEALRVLAELEGIRPEEVVAVGDATNDLPMFAAAGLGVAMSSGMAEAIAAADRVIGGHDTDAIAELVEELFLAPVSRRSPSV